MRRVHAEPLEKEASEELVGPLEDDGDVGGEVGPEMRIGRAFVVEPRKEQGA